MISAAATVTPEPNTVSAVAVRLSATVPCPAESGSWATSPMVWCTRSVANSVRKPSSPSKWLCSTPFAQPASSVMARLVTPAAPSLATIRSVAANSCSRSPGIATPRIGELEPLAKYGRSPIVWAHAHSNPRGGCHRGARPREGLPGRHESRRRHLVHRPGGGDLRLPGPERVRQDDGDQDPGHLAEADSGCGTDNRLRRRDGAARGPQGHRLCRAVHRDRR